MVDFTLKRGETRTATFALFDAAGVAFDTDGFTVSFVADGRGARLVKVGTPDAPSTLGTGTFVFGADDYTSLRPTVRGDKRIDNAYRFEVWADDGEGNAFPMLSGTFDVADVPQVG